VGIGSLAITYVDEPVLIEDVVPGEPPEVWPFLVDAFFAEGLAPDGLDAEAGLASVSRVEWMGERAGVPLGVFLDCGQSISGRDLTESARIAVAITTHLKAEGTAATRVTVRMDGVAYPLAESGERARSCTTRGELERSIIGHVREALEPDASLSGLVDPEEGLLGPSAPAPVPVRLSDLPFAPGDKIRIWVSPTERITGVFLGLQADSLLLKRSRRTAVPLLSVGSLQVKETRRRPILIGAALGVAAGVAVATSTDLGIGGRHAVQGEILNPGLGAVAGGLVGAAIGYFLGTKWVDLPVGWAHRGGMP